MIYAAKMIYAASLGLKLSPKALSREVDGLLVGLLSTLWRFCIGTAVYKEPDVGLPAHTSQAFSHLVISHLVMEASRTIERQAYENHPQG